MDYIQNAPQMANVLKRIAYININKLPANKRSPWQAVEKAYNRYRPILLKQIEVYEPKVVIGGNTLQHFAQDLHFDSLETEIRKTLTSYRSSKTIYIDAYHPVQPPCKRHIYVDEIIHAVENWWQGKCESTEINTTNRVD